MAKYLRYTGQITERAYRVEIYEEATSEFNTIRLLDFHVDSADQAEIQNVYDRSGRTVNVTVYVASTRIKVKKILSGQRNLTADGGNARFDLYIGGLLAEQICLNPEVQDGITNQHCYVGTFISMSTDVAMWFTNYSADEWLIKIAIIHKTEDIQ